MARILTTDELYMKDVTIPFIYHIAFNIVAMVVVAIGIMGNILNLIVLTRPKLKGVMYVYLLGLAVSNLSVLIIAIPALMSIAKSPEPMCSKTYAIAFFFAHLEIPLLNAFMAASVYIIIGMTVNRYISIYKPTHFQRIHTFKNAYLAIAASFLFGAVLHIPLAFQDYVYESCTDVDNKITCPKNETDDPGGGTGKEDEWGVIENCMDKTYIVCANSPYTSSIIFSIYTYCSESLLRFGPIITLTILNILIIARFNRIVRRREVLKGNAAASISVRNSNKRKITASSTSGTTSSGNNNTSTCRNNSNVYIGTSPNGDCSATLANKNPLTGENGERECSLVPGSPSLAEKHSNGRSMNAPHIKDNIAPKDEDTSACFGCFPKGCTSRKDSDDVCQAQNGHRSPLKTDGTSCERKGGRDIDRRKSSNRYLMTPDQSLAGCHHTRDANMVSNDNVSSSFCGTDLDTRTNSTALTTVSEVTAMTFAINCNGENASESATPLMTPRTPLQNRRNSSRANSKTHSLNGNASLLAPGVNPDGSSTNIRGHPHRVSSRRRGLHSPEERMLVVVLIAIVVLFVICTTPAAILSILFMKDASYFRVSLEFAIFRAMANNFELLGFALNFFVYCLCSADIRRAFVDVLFENCIVTFIKTHIFSRWMFPLRTGTPRGSNISYEVQVRPAGNHGNHRPSFAAMDEVSEHPAKEISTGATRHAVQNTAVIQKRGSFADGAKTNGLKHPESSILASHSTSNQNISATNANAINSIITIVTENKCNGEENDTNDKVTTPSAENV